MTTINYIKKYIATLPSGKAFSPSELRHLASTDNIRQILSRLTKIGELKRVARGVFIKPKPIAKMGVVLPSPTEIAKTLTKSTGETIAIQGAEAARILQLTTQVPMQLIFYTSGNTRALKINNRTVKLKHVNPSRLIAAGTTSGLVISALSYLGRDNVSTQTIERIKHCISAKEFKHTLGLTKQMPAWMSDIFYHYQQKSKRNK